MVIKFKSMKHFILWLLLFSCILTSCKTDKKAIPSKLKNTAQLDSIKIQKQVVQEKTKSLKEKLIGKTYRKVYEIPEFENYSSGGFLIGSTFNNEHIINGKEYTVKIINGTKGELLYLIFNEIYSTTSKGKTIFKIIDLLEVETETDVFKRFPEKSIDIFSDVLFKGKRAPELLALAEYEEAEEMTNVYKVWRANRKTGKFEEVKDISGITVVNEDY